MAEVTLGWLRRSRPRWRNPESLGQKNKKHDFQKVHATVYYDQMQRTLGRTFRPLLTDFYWMWLLGIAFLFAGIAFSLRGLSSIDAAITATIKTTPHALKPLMVSVSDLASVNTTLIMAGAMLVVLILVRQWRYTLVTLAALTAMPLFGLLKLLVKRSRPDPNLLAAIGLHNDSFPSGHATASCILFLTLSYLAHQSLSRAWALAITVVAVILIVAIGFSRIYLGYHYPTDVLAGWLVAIFVFLIVKRCADNPIPPHT